MAGRNTKLTASQIYDLNAVGYPEYQIGLGNEVGEPKNLKDKNIDQLSTDENFYGYFNHQLKGGGATTGATGTVAVLSTPIGNNFEYVALGAGQTLLNGAQTANGWDIAGDAANDEGFEVTQGIARYYAKHSFVMGTDNCYFEAKIKLSDVSETDSCLIGFRKAEAYQAAYTGYADYCAININAGDMILTQETGGAGTVTADTTLNVLDTNYAVIRWEVSDTVGLASAIQLANIMKLTYTGHIANTTQHTTAADTVNVLTAADATNLATLKLLVADLLTKYAAHEVDAGLLAPAYHDATETGAHTLVSAAAPTTLFQCITRLNDLKAKFKDHDDDATAHAVLTQYPVSNGYASSCTLKYGINTGALTTYDNAVGGYIFTPALVVVPYLYFLRSSGNALTTELMSWKCGLL